MEEGPLQRKPSAGAPGPLRGREACLEAPDRDSESRTQSREVSEEGGPWAQQWVRVSGTRRDRAAEEGLPRAGFEGGRGACPDVEGIHAKKAAGAGVLTGAGVASSHLAPNPPSCGAVRLVAPGLAPGQRTCRSWTLLGPGAAGQPLRLPSRPHSAPGWSTLLCDGHAPSTDPRWPPTPLLLGCR